jgi:hypothetical protein
LEAVTLIDLFRYIVFPPRNFGLEMTFAKRHAHRAPHLGRQPFVPGTRFLTRKQSGKRPPRRRAMSA